MPWPQGSATSPDRSGKAPISTSHQLKSCTSFDWVFGRGQRIFEFLVKAPIDDALYRVMESRTDIAWDDIEPAATMSFRGARPTTEDDWIKRIEATRELLGF